MTATQLTIRKPIGGELVGSYDRSRGPRKALFLDRDGIININHGYVHSPAKTDWVTGIFELCQAARDADYLLVVVTNQAGIDRGLYTEVEFEEYTRWMHERFAERGAPIVATYYCPHHPEFSGGCECRKPKPGMLFAAASDLEIDLSASILIGDSESDIAAAAAAGVSIAIMCDESSARHGALSRLRRIF